MSEENSQVSNQADNASSASEEQYVSKNAYEGVTKDMHKYKSKLKEREAYIAELEAQTRAAEEAALAEKQQYKELFEKRDAEFERLKQEREDERRAYLEGVKRQALKQELGNIKDEYLVHADLSSIQFSDDGRTISRESIQDVANSFREKYPELIPVKNVKQPTGTAAPTDVSVSGDLKPLSQMNYEEKRALMNNQELMDLYRSRGLI